MRILREIPMRLCMTSEVNQSTSHLPFSSRRVISFGAFHVTRPQISNTEPDGIVGVQQLQEYENSVAVEFSWSGLLTAGTNVKIYF